VRVLEEAKDVLVQIERLWLPRTALRVHAAGSYRHVAREVQTKFLRLRLRLRNALCRGISTAGLEAVVPLCGRLKKLNLWAVPQVTDSVVRALARHCTQMESINFQVLFFFLLCLLSDIFSIHAGKPFAFERRVYCHEQGRILWREPAKDLSH
jgi:hypothetical protein